MRSRSTVLAVLATIAFVTGLLAVAVSPARADSERTRDLAKDVVETNDVGGGSQVRKRRDAARDLLTGKARYADRLVVVKLKVRNLAAENYIAIVDLETTQGHYRVFYNREDAAAVARDWQVVSGAATGCADMTIRPMRAKDLVKVTVPRRCIGGTTRWVRWGAVLGHIERDGVTLRMDDLRRDAKVDTDTVRLGRRVSYN